MPEAQKKNETDTKGSDNGEKARAADSGMPPESDAQNTTEEGDTGKGKGYIGVIAFVALIVAIGAFVAGYISLQEIGGRQADLDQRISATQQRISKLESGAESIRSLAETVQGSNQSMQDRLDAMAGKVGELDTKLDSNLETLQQGDTALRQSLDKIQAALSAGKDDDLLVAEARHLINIANHQARLNHNPAAAAAALEAANQRLGQSGDPGLLEVRKTITDDIIALRNAADPDISGIALTLSQLENSVDGLALRHEAQDSGTAEAPPPAAEVSGVAGFFSKIWDDIKGLVTIRRNSAEQGTALLPPGQRFFLQQNLRLKLEAARLALLQRDTQTFRTSLETATQWLERYFDSDAAANMIATLSPYQSLELQPELPDISAALRALDEWRSTQQNAANGEVTGS